MAQAIEGNPMNFASRDESLRSMLWTGLESSMKSISEHKFEIIPNHVDLVGALREIEDDQVTMTQQLKTTWTLVHPELKVEISEIKKSYSNLLKTCKISRPNLRATLPISTGQEVSMIMQKLNVKIAWLIITDLVGPTGT